jgi:hypothetical protein
MSPTSSTRTWHDVAHVIRHQTFHHPGHTSNSAAQNSVPIQQNPNQNRAKRVLSFPVVKSVAQALYVSPMKTSKQKQDRVYMPNRTPENRALLPPEFLHRDLDLPALARHGRTRIPGRAVHGVWPGAHNSDPAAPSIVRQCQFFDCAADECCYIWSASCSGGRRCDDEQAQRCQLVQSLLPKP